MLERTRVMLAHAPMPEQLRLDLHIEPGLTIVQILDQSLPDWRAHPTAHLRVTLASTSGVAVIDPYYWARVRPRPGVTVMIRLVPQGSDGLKSVLTAVIVIGAVAAGQAWASSLITTAGVGQSLLAAGITAGLTTVGMGLVNSLIPTAKPKKDTRKNSYSTSGWSNEARPGGVLPCAFGTHRFAPPLAATTYTEIVGSEQYVRALFAFGYGPVNLDDFRIGDTSLSEYDDVEIEVRDGRDTDTPVTLYPRQVLEVAEGVELVRPLPRDDAGNITDGDSIETPVVRYTAADTAEISVILSFAQGLFRVDDKGRVKSQRVTIRVEQQAEGAVDWTEVTTLDITAKRRDAFFRQHVWTPPSRGRWAVRITRLTPEQTDTQISDRVALAALQSIRPEYPIALDTPISLVALRIRATYQLNGALDEFNGIVRRYAPVWDGDGWSEGLSRNPASAFIAALKGASNPYPVTDAELDWDALAAWFEFCDAKGLKYDAVIEDGLALRELLSEICAAGRAFPRHDGLHWSVVIDRPDDLIVDHLNPRNTAQISWSRSYIDPPHAFRVQFKDETNGWAEAERLIPWPGHEGEITLSEALELPGKTDPDEVFREARRRQLEILHRPDTFTAIQSGAVRFATRGDTVIGAYDVLDGNLIAARVQAVMGDLIVLDEDITLSADTDWGLRYRRFDEDDTIGTSTVIAVTQSTPGSAINSSNAAALLAGDLVQIGPISTQTETLKIARIEATEDMGAHLTLIPAAPEIDDTIDALEIPEWNGRVGAEINADPQSPATPSFAGVSSGLEGTGVDGQINVDLAPGTGAVAVAEYDLDHRLYGAPSWTTVTLQAADGATEITGYAHGDIVELRCRARGRDASNSDWSAVLTIEVGAGDVPIPAALDAGAVVINGGLGHAQISVATSDDPNTDQMQIYRVPAGDALDKELHAIGDPVTATPLTTITIIDGDATRTNLLSNADFEGASDWTLDAYWIISDGKASHSAGVSDHISQDVALTSGKYYRIGYTISDRTDGEVLPILTGGSDRAGLSISANGAQTDRIQAVSGNTAFAIEADAYFDGAIDDVVLYQETASSIAAGNYEYYAEPLNTAGVAGPMTGPVALAII